MKENHSESNFNQVLWLAISSFSTFALALVSAAILSRFLSKEDYGTYKQILFIYTTLQVVFSAGLPGVFAYFIPRLTNGQGKFLINSINRVFILIGLFFSIFLYLISGIIADVLNNPELSIGLKIFSPFPLFTIPAIGVEGIYTAIRKTKSILIYQLFNKLLMLFFIVLPVIIWHGSYRMAIIGWGIASFFTFLVAMYLKNRPYTEVAKEWVPDFYKTIFDYSLPLMGASLVGFVLHSANPFFISRYYGTEVYAEYSNGYITLPFIVMIAGSIKNVLLPLFSKAEKEGNMKEALETYYRAFLQSINLVYPMVFFCLFFARDIVILLYGEQYEASKTFLQISLIRDFAEVIPYFSVLLAIGRSKIYLIIHVFATILIWGLDFVVVSVKLPAGYIALNHALVQIIVVITGILYLRKYYRISLLNISIIKRVVFVSMHLSLTIIILIVIRNEVMANWNLIISLIATGILYYVIIIFSGNYIGIDYEKQLLARIQSLYR